MSMPEPYSIGLNYPSIEKPQEPADVAVIIPTFGRPSIANALQCIYEQDLNGTIQILIGVDAWDIDSADLIKETAEKRPSNVSVMLVDMGYSTSIRRGGVHLNSYNGSLRVILGYMANSQYLTFLDDDNYWAPNHLSSLKDVIPGFGWAYSNRYLIDEVTGIKLCVDRWDSVGPGKGIRKEELKGFVDPNCIMINKMRLSTVITAWLRPLSFSPFQAADRLFFKRLIETGTVAWTGEPTVGYSIRRKNYLWRKIIPKMKRDDPGRYKKITDIDKSILRIGKS